MPVIFITGSSRGLGAEIAEEALSRGHQVVASARDAESVLRRFADGGADLLAVPLDVTDEAQARAAVRQAVTAFGHIDALVNNAGRGLLGAVEEVSDAEARAVFDVNVFGLLNVTRAVVPALRDQGAGTIVNISSVAGVVGSPGWGIYAATKFAVEGLSEALRAELAPRGVSVTTVEPGYFRTDFLDSSSLHTAVDRIDDYARGPVRATRSRAATVNHLQPGDPARAARAVLDLIEAADPPARLPLGRDAVASVEAKLTRVRAELEAWRHVSEATDHDDVAAG